MSEYNQPVPNHKTMNFKSILRVISLSHIYFVDPLNWLKLLSLLSHSNKFWQFYFVLQTILGTKGSIFKDDIYFCPTLLWTLRIKSISCLTVLTLNLIFWQCAVIRKTFPFVVLADRKASRAGWTFAELHSRTFTGWGAGFEYLTTSFDRTALKVDVCVMWWESTEWRLALT